MQMWKKTPAQEGSSPSSSSKAQRIGSKEARTSASPRDSNPPRRKNEYISHLARQSATKELASTFQGLPETFISKLVDEELDSLPDTFHVGGRRFDFSLRRQPPPSPVSPQKSASSPRSIPTSLRDRRFSQESLVSSSPRSIPTSIRDRRFSGESSSSICTLFEGVSPESLGPSDSYSNDGKGLDEAVKAVGDGGKGIRNNARQSEKGKARERKYDTELERRLREFQEEDVEKENRKVEDERKTAMKNRKLLAESRVRTGR
jgi:hypothetical protein